MTWSIILQTNFLIKCKFIAEFRNNDSENIIILDLIEFSMLISVIKWLHETISNENISQFRLIWNLKI